MAKFEPNTLIYFCRTGLDEYNKVYFDPSQSENQVVTWALRARVATCQNYSFQRTDGRLLISVDSNDIDYYTLMQCDTVCYRNLDYTPNTFWIVGLITAVEWVNPGCSRVYYDVDYFSTYSQFIEWDSSYCFVEREHVKEDWIENGGECPAFSNMGPAENFSMKPDTPVYYCNFDLLPDKTEPKVAIYSPYGEDGQKANFNGVKGRGNVYTGLTCYLKTIQEANDYLNAVAESDQADIDRISVLQTVPPIVWENTFVELTVTIPMPWLYKTRDIQSSSSYFDINFKRNVNDIKYRNAKCWSAQFCKLRLQSSDGDTLDYNPQWFGNGIADTTMHMFSSRSEGEIMVMAGLKPKNIDFSQKGMSNFMVGIRNTPTAPWVGNAYAQWQVINSEANTMRGIQIGYEGIGGAVKSILGGYSAADSQNRGNMGKLSGFISGAINAGGALVDAGTRIAELEASITQAEVSGATVNGSFSTSSNGAAAMGIYGFQLSAYVVQPYIMDSIDDFFDVYGYNVNKIKVPERNTRSLWNFVKCRSAHISGEKLSYVARAAIESLLNAGVTFWNGSNISPDGAGGINIGDYSMENRKRNRAISGG